MQIVKYSLEQWILMYDIYVKKKSFKLCKLKFCHKYPCVCVPALWIIFEFVKKVYSSGTFIKKKYAWQNAVLTEEMFQQIASRLQILPHKSLA